MSETNHIPSPGAGLTQEQKVDKILILALNSSEDLKEVKTDVKSIRDTVDKHTTNLDAIVKDQSNWQTEMTVLRGRMKRFEDALEKVAKKLKLDLGAFLH